MRGFIIGTLATAVTFAIVAFLLPQIDYGDNISGLIVVALIQPWRTCTRSPRQYADPFSNSN